METETARSHTEMGRYGAGPPWGQRIQEFGCRGKGDRRMGVSADGSLSAARGEHGAAAEELGDLGRLKVLAATGWKGGRGKGEVAPMWKRGEGG